MTNKPMNIPQEYQDFCKEVGRVARKYGLSEFSGRFRPPVLTKDWHSEIGFAWTQGRHGIDKGMISIHSEVFVIAKIDEEGKDLT